MPYTLWSRPVCYWCTVHVPVSLLPGDPQPGTLTAARLSSTQANWVLSDSSLWPCSSAFTPFLSHISPAHILRGTGPDWLVKSYPVGLCAQDSGRVPVHMVDSSLLPPPGLHGDLPAHSSVWSPTLPPGSHRPSLSSACSSFSSRQHGLVSLGTMCLCHRQQCPFISSTLALVHPGTPHKGCFVPLRDVSSLLCHIGAADQDPVLESWLCNSQLGLWGEPAPPG